MQRIASLLFLSFLAACATHKVDYQTSFEQFGTGIVGGDVVWRAPS